MRLRLPISPPGTQVLWFLHQSHGSLVEKRKMGSHDGACGSAEAQATRDACYGVPTRESGCRISLAGRRILVLAAVVLCAKPCAAGSAGPAHGRTGPGLRTEPPRLLTAPAHMPHGTPSPVSSPATSRHASDGDLKRAEHLRGTASLTLAAAAVAAERRARRGPGRGIARTVSYRSGLSDAGAVEDGAARLAVPARTTRADSEYRARGDPTSEVFTRLQTGLYPHLNLS